MSLRIDFVSGRLQWRRKHGGGRGQAVARAVGIRPGRSLPRVLDATAGLGRDAFILASLGCRVHALERHPEVARALQLALERAEQDAETAAAIEGRLSFEAGDAQELFGEVCERFRPDVIYLDPMHPPPKKSALVMKELREFRTLVGVDDDAEQLLAAALRTKTPRVVLKLPLGAEPFQPAPAQSMAGRTTRFDLYLSQGVKC